MLIALRNETRTMANKRDRGSTGQKRVYSSGLLFGLIQWMLTFYRPIDRLSLVWWTAQLSARKPAGMRYLNFVCWFETGWMRMICCAENSIGIFEREISNSIFDESFVL